MSQVAVPQPEEEDVAEWVEALREMTTQEGGKILFSLAVVAGLLLLRFLVMRVAARRVEDPRRHYQVSKYSARTAFAVGLVLVGVIWLEWLQTLATFLGLVAAGLAIALRDLVANLAGWLFILARRPFEVGDRIQIGEHAGDVVDIRVFQFTILEIGNWVHADQSTGRVIHLPNGDVFREPLANYTAKFAYVWDELSVRVTFESDWRRAKAILEEILAETVGEAAEDAEREIHQASRSFLIYYRRLTPIVYTSVVENGVLLSLRYLAPPRRRRGTAQALWERILDAFSSEDSIQFAYPTHRFHLNLLEGKEGVRGEPPGWVHSSSGDGAGPPPPAQWGSGRGAEPGAGLERSGGVETAGGAERGGGAESTGGSEGAGGADPDPEDEPPSEPLRKGEG